MPANVPESAASWNQRVRRAEHLAAENGPAAALLAFYALLLREQAHLYQSFNAQPPAGSIDADLPRITASGLGLLRTVADRGSDRLATEARSLLDADGSAREQRLLEYWQDPSDRDFFSKALLQPYGQWLADNAIAPRAEAPLKWRPTSVRTAPVDCACPRCGGAPQLSILEASGAMTVDGSSRRLQCAVCLSTWPFRRVVCPSCGEEDERKVAYYQPSELPHVRVDACETCRRYLKTVDLGRLGLAIPLVDEVAGASLDIWAREQGFEKIELNLVGL